MMLAVAIPFLAGAVLAPPSYRGSLNAVGYEVSVPRLGSSRVMTSCRVAWVS